MGNLGAGKSTLGKLLEQQGWTRVVIDDFRLTAENEYHARNAMLYAIHRGGNRIVYETTTANAVHSKALKALELNGYDVKKVLLLISEAESYRRHTGSSPWGKTHAESYAYIEGCLRREWADVVVAGELELIKVVGLLESMWN